MKYRVILFLALGMLHAFNHVALSKNSTISIPMNEVRAYSGDRGAFYVFSISVPQDVLGKRLDSVFLEFAIDATPLAMEDSFVVTPVVGAYPLAANYAGGLAGGVPGRNLEPVFNNIVPSSRPVATGDNRLVKMDITDIVKGWIANPQSNHGVVIGSLVGPQLATVTLNETFLGSETPIRVTFFYQNRFGDRISSRDQK